MLGVQPPFGRNYARSMVISQQGIAATSQALASQAGAQTLAEGGSAADAAIAANAVLGVVEPMMNGIGGDLFVLYWEAKTGKLTGLNASGPAPRALSPGICGSSRDYSVMADAGIHAVTVPGAVDGWAKMHARFGKLPWKKLVSTRDRVCGARFPGFRYRAEAVGGMRQMPASCSALPETARVFLPNDRAATARRSVPESRSGAGISNSWPKTESRRSIRERSPPRFSRLRKRWAA